MTMLVMLALFCVSVPLMLVTLYVMPFITKDAITSLKPIVDEIAVATPGSEVTGVYVYLTLFSSM